MLCLLSRFLKELFQLYHAKYHWRCASLHWILVTFEFRGLNSLKNEVADFGTCGQISSFIVWNSGNLVCSVLYCIARLFLLVLYRYAFEG
ncbi:hypothetical protein RchiOBHm_Chr0c39g0503191 [Rosa chinensis]|uniref:Uncharacterized protein n=1 Tax=Rosa chinensis TaxID=74649 RepID=A0A2P6SQ66_ROSCH|nr:hypothetical protein RchiOBHm_Chr0c39g0503191 [Rosa chinensis]